MYLIETEIEIAASPERVWSILMDFPAYPEWNPFIRSLSGVAKPGEKLRAFIQPEEHRAMTLFSNGYTRFTQGEQFSGILVGIFISSMEAATKAGFNAMNQALKNRAEANDHMGHVHDDISKEWY